MGWLVLGLAVGWLTASFYWYTQRGEDAETTSNGAGIMIALLFVLAMVVGASSVNWGAHAEPTPTPTSLGR